jgi:pyruvate dehydrogenase E1 component alpha subunit
VKNNGMAQQRRVLNQDGSLVKGAKPKLDEEFTLEALRWMLMSRLLDQRATTLQRQGRWGVFSPVLGQEAAVVGSAMATDPSRDWLVPQYRETIAYVRHGLPLVNLAASYMGKVDHGRIPDGVNLLPLQVALAAQLQHATGLAWGLKLQKKDAVVMTYIGEGGSSEGDFHEALNLAGVVKAPIVFVLQNNNWAISTPRKLQSAAPSFALRAQGYGFPGVEVDGNDVLAVYEAAQEAMDRARAGEGPTLIEAVTYRMSFHNTTDNPKLYQDEKEWQEAKKKDPIERVEAYLSALGLWDGKRSAEMQESILQEIDQAIEKATSLPVVRPEQLFEHSYESPPERVRRQREELLGRIRPQP